MDHHGLRTLALAQHGLATRRQILDLGGTDALIARRIRTGQWARSRRGVIVIGAVAPSWEQRVMAACLAAGDGALASHRTAGRHWGLVSRSGRIQILAGDERVVALDQVHTHRTLILPPVDRTIHRGIPITSVARTLVDLAAGQDQTVVGGWLDDAMRRLELDPRELRSCIARLAGPGRPRPTPLVDALAERWAGYDPGDSALEARALLAIARAGLPAPVQQHAVRRPDGRLAFVDLAYPDRMVAIELDGYEHHRSRSAFDQDRARANDLTLLGWRVYRFTWTMSDEDIVATVAQAIGWPASSAPSDPSDPR